ncbi:LPS export ABC transporter periplasmic protein LptC [Acidiphilium sp.]|uniref:LPS export ABC transporter periplasmic protein LptC n=1 Tax=Acidiphilium sp. TaxID=527 RepID=UPI003CFF0BE0
MKSTPPLAPDRIEQTGKPPTLFSADGIFATLSRTRAEQRALLGRHRRTVAIFKFVLPTLAAGLIVALAVFPNLHNGANIGRITYHKPSTTTGAPLSRMSIAQYRGVDAQGEKFTITAHRVVQVTTNRLDLLAPKGDLTTNAGSWLMLNARRGLYHQNNQVLDLAGRVTLYRADGTVLHTHRATIDIKGGAATGHDPVRAFGPFGTLHSRQGFIATDHGRNILFKGQSTLMLDQLPVPAIAGAGQ